MRLSPPADRAVKWAALSAVLCLAALAGACSTASGPSFMSTASLPPRPSEGMLQQPRAAYAPASAIGAPMPVSNTGYQWNGNRERIQTGAAHNKLEAQQPTASAKIKWQATPRSLAPAADKVPSIADGRPTESYPTEGVREIVVGPGDTLYSLATRHRVSVANLIKINHLQGSALAVNQHLVLPATSR